MSSDINQDFPQAINEWEVAVRLGMSVSWVRKARQKGGGVPYHKNGKSVRYDIPDVEEFQRSTLRRNTSDNGPDS
jgi:lipoate-protein ligase B